MVSMSVFALKGKKRELYGRLYLKCTGNNQAQDELGCRKQCARVSHLERYLEQFLFSNKKEKKAKQIKQKIKDKMEK